MHTKIFTYVSPSTNKQASRDLCSRMPIILRPIGSIEELFPLLSDPSYHTDFVSVCINSFNETGQTLDIFNVLLTLDTLIKATVRRVAGESKPLRRDTKIIILVTEKTNITLIKQAISMPYVYAVTKVLEREDQVSEASEYIKKLTTGEVTHHPDIINLLKSKKKLVEKNKDTITLTVRQSQILQLVQTRGASNKTIAKMLGISESTVKLHMGAILKKYGAKNRTQLAVFSTENSL